MTRLISTAALSLLWLIASIPAFAQNAALMGITRIDEPSTSAAFDLDFNLVLDDVPGVTSVSVTLGDGTQYTLDEDYHIDEDFAARTWHHYPLQRWSG